MSFTELRTLSAFGIFLPQYKALSEVLPKYPKAAGALFQTYNDLKLGESAVR